MIPVASSNQDFEDETVLNANLFKVGSTIEFSVDAIRSVEVLFQPYFVGNDQVEFALNKLGLSETICLIANRFPQEIRNKLLKNLYLRGGGAKFDRISDRIVQDLRKNYDESLEVNVHITEDPVGSNYELMHRMLTERKAELQKYWITRQQFEENTDSSDLFKSFAFSNY